MKIALCLSGQPRNYELGYQELKKWFLDKYDIDVYLHAWKYTSNIETGHNFTASKTYSFTEQDYQNLLELYKPKSWIFQYPIPFDDTDIRGVPLNYKLSNILSAAYSIRTCFNLLNNFDTKYDLVIRTRFDLQFTDYISPECIFLKDLSLLDPNKFNTFSYPLTVEGFTTRQSEVDDLFVVSSPKITDIYTNYFGHIIKYIWMDENYPIWLNEHISENPDKIVAESLLKYHLVSNNIDIEYIPSLTEHYTAHIIR